MLKKTIKKNSLAFLILGGIIGTSNSNLVEAACPPPKGNAGSSCGTNCVDQMGWASVSGGLSVWPNEDGLCQATAIFCINESGTCISGSQPTFVYNPSNPPCLKNNDGTLQEC